MENYAKYEPQRIALQIEVNKTLIETVSFERYKKTPEERHNLKVMKADYKKSLKA